jgi:hypothetical protein
MQAAAATHPWSAKNFSAGTSELLDAEHNT